MRISDWSSDVCSSDLESPRPGKEIVVAAPDHLGRRACLWGRIWLNIRDTGRACASGCSTAAVRRCSTMSFWNICLRSRFPGGRSEEHTSELQSLMRISYAVFCLKKKKQIQQTLKCCT